MKSVIEYLKSKDVLLSILLSLFFVFSNWVYTTFGGIYNLTCLKMPLDKSISWDNTLDSYKIESATNDKGFILIVKNAASQPRVIELTSGNIENLKNILTYNFNTEDKILKNEKNNGWLFQKQYKIESLQVSKGSALPLVSMSARIDPHSPPKLTYSKRIIPESSIITSFEKWLYITIIFVIGGIIGYYLTNLKSAFFGFFILLGSFFRMGKELP